MTPLEQALENLKRTLLAHKLPTDWYVIPDYDGFKPVLNKDRVDVYCLEANLGPTLRVPDHDLYAAIQFFDPDYPNMGLILTYLRHREHHTLGREVVIFEKKTDYNLSVVFLPEAHMAFTHLDPHGNGKGINIQRYAYIDIAREEFLPALRYTMDLSLSVARYGQLAQIAVDFRDTPTGLLSFLTKPLGLLAKMHDIPHNGQPSQIQIPLRKPNDEGVYRLESSTALDEGIAIAHRYLRMNQRKT